MTTWRKSSHSGAGGTEECVELAVLPNAIGVRDSKAPQFGHVVLSREAFAVLVGRVKRGGRAF
ncbi:DUF397 domain-containing protein [Actinomadura sp. B10D3]|uniref:DUF397 domain-containing protein n=1 Tax=Actinomadura sp. B10D3 TaxID=3153557 RepID=UPI00325D414C